MRADLPTSFLSIIKYATRLFVILIACAGLSACLFSANKAPTKELGQTSSSNKRQSTHVVRSGETLFAIAWRHGVDYKTLAGYNNIGNSFLIYPGERLKIPPLGTVLKPSKPKVTAPARTSSRSSAVAKTPPKRSAPKSVSRASSQSTSKSAQSSARSKKPSTTAKAVTKSIPSSGKVKWRWPAKGRVLTNFSSKKGGNKGIDIAGKKGEAVIAASSGSVVYAGSGLRGYGKLVIIKHSETYLSAYAHNDRLRVKEGQIVKAGQRIADIGSSGSRTDGVKLHFEIRRNGQPINPIRLLPKR